MSGRRPAAFDLDEVRFEPDDLYETPAAPETPAVAPPSRRRGWWGVLASAAGALLALGLGMAVDRLIADLFARAEWLGWIGVGLAALLALAVVAIVAREVRSILRLRRIDRLREAADEAHAADDRQQALKIVDDVTGLYARRPETARGRGALAAHRREIIDGRDLLALTERELLAPLDARAQARIVNAARRVAVVTAISPRTTIDMLFVIFQVVTLIRQLAETYGARPGMLGLARLFRQTLAHLAVTGGMSAGDSIVQQVLGHGLAARLSARLGEGVVNGLLTARIGIAAAEVCRPLPYREGTPPRIGDVMAVLRPLGEEKAKS